MAEAAAGRMLWHFLPETSTLDAVTNDPNRPNSPPEPSLGAKPPAARAGREVVSLPPSPSPSPSPSPRRPATSTPQPRPWWNNTSASAAPTAANASPAVAPAARSPKERRPTTTPAPDTPSSSSHVPAARPLVPSTDEGWNRLTTELRSSLREVIRTTVQAAVRESFEDKQSTWEARERRMQQLLERIEAVQLTVQSQREHPHSAARSDAHSMAGRVSFQADPRPLTPLHASLEETVAAAPARPPDVAAALRGPSRVEAPAPAASLVAPPSQPWLATGSEDRDLELPGELNGLRKQKRARLILVGTLVLIAGAVLFTTLLSHVQ